MSADREMLDLSKAAKLVRGRLEMGPQSSFHYNFGFPQQPMPKNKNQDFCMLSL